MIECHICHIKLPDEEFKSHPYKIHKVKQEDYFLKFYNKRDLLTGERIPFKSISQYLSTDFVNKNNLRSWVKTNNKDTIREYCLRWLQKRKEKPEVRYAPCQTELKTLVFPTINYLDDLFNDDGGYYKVCENLGYFLRHDSLEKGVIMKPSFTYSPKIKLLTDTREHKPLLFSCATEVATLNWGDYALNFEELSGKVRIERKSLTDFIGTLSGAYDRFSREIERAEKDKGYLVVLIEEKFSNFLSFNYLPHISRRTKATPDFIGHRMRELCQKYDSLQFIFADGRREAAVLVMKILQLGSVVKKTDLQLAYDLGVLL